MHGDATTVPPAGALAPARAGASRMLARLRAEPLSSEVRVRACVVAVSAIVVICALLVLMTANRPSVLSPTSHYGFYPRWMAGPLGGLWPSLTRDTNTLRYLFTAGLALMFVAYLVALRLSRALPARFLLGALLAVHVIFVLAPPMALTDVFNYVNYARMEVVHGLNPYTTIPILEPHTDPAFALSNWHELLSPYGPLFTLLTFAVVPLGVAGSFWALKVLLAATSLAMLWLVWKCARLLGRDPVTAVMFVGLNPIVLVWGLGGDHNDFLMLLFIVLAVYLLLIARRRAGAAAGAGSASAGASAGAGAGANVDAPHGRGVALLAASAPEIGAGAAVVTAVAIKASAAVLIPIMLAALLRDRRALGAAALGMLVAGAALGVASLLAFGLHIPDLNTQSRLVTNESVPNLVGLAVGAGGENETVRVAMTAVLVLTLAACCRQAWRTGDVIAPAGWMSVVLLLTLSWVLPWYVLWALPLAALAGSRRLRLATVAVGVYLMFAWSPASTLLFSAIGFHPDKTGLGHLHQRYVRELLT